MEWKERNATAWNAHHICTQPEKHPGDFFTKSPFGKSTAYATETRQNANKTMQLNFRLKHFKELGFPPGFRETLKTRLPLLLQIIPPKRAIANHQSTIESENQGFIQEALEKWETAKVFRYTDEIPHIVYTDSMHTCGK